MSADEQRAALVAELFDAAVERPPAEREAFLEQRCGTGGEIRAEVESLLREADVSDDFLERPALYVASEPRRGAFAAGDLIGEYEIVSLIGKGGMGEVYLARDLRLHRRVALKLVRGGLDTEAMARRFEREQQLLAGLNHPNIAQLYASGVTRDAIPFFAMEYVEGTPLDYFIKERPLGLRERLELFRKICSALVYAHQHLVIHRDIKPANIRVTPNGEPKLLDFGIAKLLDELAEDAAEQTLTMQRMLTPDYASPEQIRGERISTASDVYSLGVVLYELLTGERPYRLTSRHPKEIERAITGQDPSPPSASRNGNPQSAIRNPHSLRGDLDNIVLMALRKEPERRYPSVAAFAEDIRRYLEGLPVRARKDTFAYRASKFVKRHRVGVAAVAVVLLSLVGGIVATTMQARRAERRFNDIRALANSLIFEILPKMSLTNFEARQLATQRAVEYLDVLARDAGDDPALLHDLVEAYRALGDVTGGGKGDDLTRIEIRRKAVAVWERLRAARPNDPKIQDELARDYQGVAWSSWMLGDNAGALEAYEKCFALRETLYTRHPHVFDYVYRLAHVHLTKGELFLNADQPAEARRLFTRALNLIESLQNHPDTPRQEVRFQRGLLWAHNCVGDSFELEDDLDRASEHYVAAAVFSEPMYVRTPTDQNAMENITRTYAGQARVHVKRGEYEAAEAKVRRAIEIREAVPERDAYLIAPLAELYSELGAVKIAAGEAGAALEPLGAALRLQEELVAIAPRNAMYAAQLAATSESLGLAQRKLGDFAGAEQRYMRALALREQGATDLADTGAQKNLALCYEALGTLHTEIAAAPSTSADKRLEHWRSARAQFERSRSILQALCDKNPQRSAWATALANVSERLLQCDHALARR